jgi:hypothetical protein
MTIDTTTISPLAAVLDATERAVHADPAAAAAEVHPERWTRVQAACAV